MSKLCLLLPNISHTWLECRGNIPAIAEKHGYECKVHDRAEEWFDERKEIDAIKKTIGNNAYEKVIIISNSFGDMIARKLLRQWVGNVIAHISICGVSELKYMSWSSKLLLIVAAHLWKHCYKNKKLVKYVAKLFNRKASNFAADNAHQLNTQCAIHWLTKWIADRARFILQYHEAVAKIDTPVSILFSKNDNNFSDPEANAEHIAAMYNKKTIITLWNAWHGSFLEMPEKYDPVIEDIFDNYNN